MLRPKQVKFRKMRKHRIKTLYEPKSNKLKFGLFGIQATEHGKITARQIEAVRRTITAAMKRKGKLWIRIFPSYSITSKPLEVRMGGGKGAVKEWIARIRPGKVLYEVAGNENWLIFKALNNAKNKLPVSAKIITRNFK